MGLNVDFKFIGEMEGAAKTRGYVPNVKTSFSGVTVGTGIDLGQMSQYEIKNLKISKDLIKKLLPYASLVKDSALTFLNAHPLVLTPAEVNQLDSAIWTRELSEIESMWNGARKGGQPEFAELSRGKQTVLFSVHYQYGNLPTRTPKFWKQVTSGDWKAAVVNLRDFGDAYDRRHEREADLLKGEVK